MEISVADSKVVQLTPFYWAVSDRVLLLKVAGKPLDLNIIQVYAPTSASSEEDAENFYEEIEKAKTQCKNQDPLIIMGDFNAKVGQRGDEHSVGMHGTGNRNERGERLVEFYVYDKKTSQTYLMTSEATN